MIRAAVVSMLLGGTAGVAAADGWIDCNGPDKNGRGCDVSGTDTTATIAGLGLVTVVTALVSRRRRRP